MLPRQSAPSSYEDGGGKSLSIIAGTSSETDKRRKDKGKEKQTFVDEDRNDSETDGEGLEPSARREPGSSESGIIVNGFRTCACGSRASCLISGVQ